jgi:hypothetical protein
MAFPSLVLAIGLLAVFEAPGLVEVFVVLILLGWTTIAGVVRSTVLTLKSRDYVQAALAIGAYPPRSRPSPQQAREPGRRLQPSPDRVGVSHPPQPPEVRGDPGPE